MSNKKNQWSFQQEEKLFAYHAIIGNKWASIASKLGTKDQNIIKNKFYSTLRKGLRKINAYITQVKRKVDPARFKAYKTIQEIFISKLIAVTDNNYEDKYEVRSRAIEIAPNIQHILIGIARSDDQYKGERKENYTLQQNLLNLIMQFNKNCKKRKGKKKESNIRCKQVSSEGQSEDNPLLKDSEIQIKIEQVPSTRKQQQEEKPKQQNSKQPEKQESQFMRRMKKSTPIQMYDMNSFVQQADLFSKFITQRDQGFMIKSANSMTHSGCLKSQSQQFNLKDSSMDVSNLPPSAYMTVPTPISYDSQSPYTLANMVKTQNATFFRLDKSNAEDLIEPSISCGKEINIVDCFYEAIPERPKIGQSLVESADLKMEFSQEMQIQSNIFLRIKQSNSETNKSNFAHQYSFNTNQQ